MPLTTWVSVVKDNMQSWLDYELIKEVCLTKGIMIPTVDDYYIIMGKSLNTVAKVDIDLEVAVRAMSKGNEKFIPRIIEPPLADSQGTPTKRSCCGGGKLL